MTPPAGPPRHDLLQGTLDMLILRTLQWGPQHGYAIAQTIRAQSSEVLRVEAGSLYPALQRLAKNGWVSARWGVTSANQLMSSQSTPAPSFSVGTSGNDASRCESITVSTFTFPASCSAFARGPPGPWYATLPRPSIADATATAVHAGWSRRRAARAIGRAAPMNARLLMVLAGCPISPGRIRSQSLSAPWREVYRVAIAELEKNEWTIQRSDTTRGRLVTHWKRMDHALARLVLGDVRARCVVDVVPLDPGTTELTIRGGIVGPEDLDRTAAFGAARGAYRKAAERWIERVRTTLAATTSVVDPPGAR